MPSTRAVLVPLALLSLSLTAQAGKDRSGMGVGATFINACAASSAAGGAAPGEAGAAASPIPLISLQCPLSTPHSVVVSEGAHQPDTGNDTLVARAGVNALSYHRASDLPGTLSMSSGSQRSSASGNEASIQSLSAYGLLSSGRRSAPTASDTVTVTVSY